MMRILADRFKRWTTDETGAAAVEMAFLAPVALAFLSLAFAGGQALTLDHKTVLAANSVTDIVSRTPYNVDPNNAQAELLASTDLDTDLALSQFVLYPENPTNLQVVMTELKIVAGTNTANVVWSEAYNGAIAMTCGVTVNLDPQYVASGATYLLYGQVSYAYQPLGVSFALPAMTLNASEMLTIRNAPQITVSGAQTQC